MKRFELAIRVLCALLMLSGTSWGAVIADYRVDFLTPAFNGQTRAARSADGWDYKWNKNGLIGSEANYASLLGFGSQYNTDGLAGVPRPAPGSYDYLYSLGGHPGPGSTQTAGGNSIDRYAIAAYTVQAGEAGVAQLGNAWIRVPSASSGGVEVRVYVNDTLIGSSHIQPGGALAQSFGRVLGNLNVGDTVYVALGPNAADGSDSFEVSFAIDNVLRDRYWQAPAGGAGTWNTSSSSWALDAAGASPGPWVNADNLTANFGGAGGTVSIATPVTAQALVFNTGGYLVNSTGGNLTLTSAGTTTVMPSSVRVVNAGETAEIAAQITAPTPGAGSLWKDGAGTLVLSNSTNNYGTTTVAGGTLRLGASGALPTITNDGLVNLTVQDTTLDLNNFDNILHRISVTGGTIQTGTGTLSLTYRNSSFTSSSANTTVISGNVRMVSPSSYFTFEVGDGPRAIDVQVDAKLTGTLGSSFFKDSYGTMLLTSAASDFTASSIIVRRGTLLIGANAPKNAPGALGNNNAVVQMGDGNNDVARYLLTQGAVDIGHDVNVGNYTHIPFLGGNTAHVSSFSGNITLQRGVELTAVSGGRVNFTGNISGPGGVVVLGAGEVALSGANSYTDITGVRQGTLIVGANAPSGANGALGNATSAVLVGDAIVPLTAVRAATTASVGGTFNPTGGANARGQYTGVATTIDGVALVAGDRVLVKNETGANDLRNGIYVVTATTSVWDRAADFDETAEMVHGAQVTVTAGGQNGRKFFLANLGAPVVNTTGVDWQQEPANPNVALMIGGAFTVGRDVTVTNNGSTGTSTLGGSTADASTFSGTVTLNRSTLFTAATGGTVDFTGQITGAGAVTKTGAGTVVFGNTANDFTANPTISAGVLSVPDVSNSGQPGALGSGTGIVLGSATLQFTGAGADSTDRAVTLTGSPRIDVSDSAGDLTLAGAVTGAGQTMFKVGPGKLNLTGGGTYGSLDVAAGSASLGAPAVTTSVSGGVQVGDAHTAGGGSATLDIVDGSLTAAWIQLGNTPGTAITATINQTGGSVRTTGSVAESAGLRLGHYPASTTFYNLSGGTLLVDNGFYLACAVDGTGTFYQTGGEATAERVVVNARANASGNGTFTVAGGTFNVGSGGIVNDGTGPAAVNLGGMGGTIRASATFSSVLPMTLSGTGASAITFDTNGNSITLSGVLGGAGGLNKAGAGTLTLTGDNTYTGPTTIAAGTLTFSTPSFNTYRGDTITIQGPATMNVVTTGGSNRYDFQHKTIQWDSTGGGTLSLGPNINFVLDTAGSGTTTFRTNGGAQNSIVGPGGVNMGSPGHTVNFDIAPGSGPSGLLVSAGLWNGSNLLKSGAGTLTLTGNNTYTGTTVINGGTLTVSGSGAITQTSVLRNSGGGVILNIQDNASINVLSTIVFGDASGDTSITINQSGGSVTNQGTTNNPAGNSLSNRWGHWPGGTTTYNLTGGTLNLLGAPLYLSWDGAATFNIQGGTANILGIDMGYGPRNNPSTINLTSGHLYIGSVGIYSGGTTAKNINLGGGTLGALATWASSRPMTLTGTGGNATIDTGGFNITLSGVLSGAGGLNKIGAGSLILTAQETYTGPTTVSGGTLSVASGRLYSNLGWQNRQITVNNGGIVEVGGWADGDGFGLGQVAFAPSNILVDAGTIRYVASSTAGNSDRGFTIGAGGATLEAAGSITWSLNQGRGFGIATPSGGLLTLTGAGNGAMSMILGGTGGLTKTGPGTWTLTGANTFSGATNVTGGTLALSGAGKLYSNSGWAGRSVSVSGGAVLQLENWVGTGLGEFDYAAANLMLNNATLRYVGATNANPDAGSGRAFTIGAGGATLETTNAATTWTINRYMVGANEVYPLASNGGLLTLTGAGGGVIDKVIPGSGGLAKTGAGTWSLTRGNTYGGGTTVTAGRLLVNNPAGSGSGVGTGDVTVNGGTLGGGGFIGTPADASNVTVNAGGHLAPGTSPGILTVYGNVTMNAGSFFDVEINGPTPGTEYDRLVVNGTVTLNDATLNLIFGNSVGVGQSFTIIDNDGYLDAVAGLGQFAGLPEGAFLPTAPGSGATGLAITYRGGDGNDVVLTGVPEPSTLVLIVLGLAGLALAGVRRRRR